MSIARQISFNWIYILRNEILALCDLHFAYLISWNLDPIDMEETSRSRWVLAYIVHMNMDQVLIITIIQHNDLLKLKGYYSTELLSIHTSSQHLQRLASRDLYDTYEYTQGSIPYFYPLQLRDNLSTSSIAAEWPLCTTLRYRSTYHPV